MEEEKPAQVGIKSLIERYRAAFRIPENRDYYSDQDYKAAEKLFIRYALSECRLVLLV